MVRIRTICACFNKRWKLFLSSHSSNKRMLPRKPWLCFKSIFSSTSRLLTPGSKFAVKSHPVALSLSLRSQVALRSGLMHMASRSSSLIQRSPSHSSNRTQTLRKVSITTEAISEKATIASVWLLKRSSSSWAKSKMRWVLKTLKVGREQVVEEPYKETKTPVSTSCRDTWSRSRKIRALTPGISPSLVCCVSRNVSISTTARITACKTKTLLRTLATNSITS